MAGLAIGSIVLFSNFQFGLQTGWVSMMGLPSSLLGFAAFKTLQHRLAYPFTDVENVFVQSLAVAVGTGPLAFGLVGVVPAIEKFLTPDEAGNVSRIKLSSWQLIVWSSGLAFFGVFFAVLLRRQIIVKEKLRFPSGSATATLIAVLHKTELDDIPIRGQDVDAVPEEDEESSPEAVTEVTASDEQARGDKVYYQNMKVLIDSFVVSALYTIFAFFVPIVRNLPIFGSYLAKNYLWTFQPSPAYIGQGIIMGFPTTVSMLFGAVLGWAVLTSLAEHNGWAIGPIDDWKTGGQGWILWISLAIMLADTVTSFLFLLVTSLYTWNKNSSSSFWDVVSSLWRTRATPDDEIDYQSVSPNIHVTSKETDHDASPKHLVPYSLATGGLVVALLLCIVTTRLVFGAVMPVYSLVAAVLLATLLSVLGVRALGETDLNPVSGIGKISQVLFALIVPKDHPAKVLINLVAGGITEAGAQQAGDLMQDLKTGHLIGASPKAQFYAQLIGSAWSILLSSWVYRLYDAVYEIPGSLFRIPTAVIWIDCSRLVTGQGLPPRVGEFSIAFAVIFGAIAILKAAYIDAKHRAWIRYLPSGVAVGIGMYNTPSFTLARFIGGCIAAYWASKHSDHDSNVLIIILSSGLVLGEGVFSIVTLIMTSLGVPHL